MHRPLKSAVIPGWSSFDNFRTNFSLRFKAPHAFSFECEAQNKNTGFIFHSPVYFIGTCLAPSACGCDGNALKQKVALINLNFAQHHRRTLTQPPKSANLLKDFVNCVARNIGKFCDFCPL